MSTVYVIGKCALHEAPDPDCEVCTQLAERDRQVAEQAWREGFLAGYADGTETGETDPTNPYRADSAAPARPTTDDRRWADKVADGCAEAARAALAARPAPTVNAGPLRVEYGLVWDDLGSADTFPTIEQARAAARGFDEPVQVVRIETWPVADEGRAEDRIERAGGEE